MTLQEAKSIARHLGLTLRQVRSGAYRVNFRDGNETTAYYTDLLEDAGNTAVEMARYHHNHYRKNRERILAKRAARRAAVNNGNGTTSFFNRNGQLLGSAGSSIDRAFNFNKR